MKRKLEDDLEPEGDSKEVTEKILEKEHFIHDYFKLEFNFGEVKSYRLKDYVNVTYKDDGVYLKYIGKLLDANNTYSNSHLLPVYILAGSINKIPNLKSLDMSNCFLSNDYIEIVLPAIKGSKTLEYIDFTNNYISSKGYQEIENIVKDNTNTKKIIFGKHERFDAISCQLAKISKHLSDNKSVDLYFRNTQMRERNILLNTYIDFTFKDIFPQEIKQLLFQAMCAVFKANGVIPQLSEEGKKKYQRIIQEEKAAKALSSNYKA